MNNKVRIEIVFNEERRGKYYINVPLEDYHKLHEILDKYEVSSREYYALSCPTQDGPED